MQLDMNLRPPPSCRNHLAFGRLAVVCVFINVVLCVVAPLGIAQSPAASVDGANTNVGPPPTGAASRTSDQEPLTDRERALLERIRNLEQRLAAVESKVSPAPAESGTTPAAASQPASSASGTKPQNEDGPPTAGSSNAPSTSVTLDSSTAQAQGTSKTEGGYSEPTIWGEWNPGPGFRVASTEKGDLNLSGYMVARYLNQLPAEQSAVDHLGRPIAVQARQDFQFHRVMLYASGWFLNPKFKYFTFVWTVNDTTQVAVGGALSYDFNKRFQLGLGINALPVTRTVQGNHPFWPSYDRMMADEFFRPFFTQGLFGGGELFHRLYYKWMTGNNLSTLGVKATQLTRELNFGGSLTWMPTTGEFGPRGALGDFEEHDKLATRFGIGWGVSRENRQSNENDPTNNTTIRLADSLNIFDPNTFANGVTVQKATWHLLAGDVGFKKRGLWIGGEGYYRLLNDFVATGGPMPVRNVRDTGFYAQATYMIVPKLAEVYAGTSYVFSHYGAPKEFLYGANWYPARNRQWRLNLHIINVDHSPVNSTFGFYMGQLKGPIIAVGATALY